MINILFSLQFTCLVDKMAYMEYVEENKDMENNNVKESLEMGIAMADSCSMMEKGMGPKEAPEVVSVWMQEWITNISG